MDLGWKWLIPGALGWLLVVAGAMQSRQWLGGIAVGCGICGFLLLRSVKVSRARRLAGVSVDPFGESTPELAIPTLVRRDAEGSR